MAMPKIILVPPSYERLDQWDKYWRMRGYPKELYSEAQRIYNRDIMSRIRSGRAPNIDEIIKDYEARKKIGRN